MHSKKKLATPCLIDLPWELRFYEVPHLHTDPKLQVGKNWELMTVPRFGSSWWIRWGNHLANLLHTLPSKKMVSKIEEKKPLYHYFLCICVCVLVHVDIKWYLIPLPSQPLSPLIGPHVPCSPKNPAHVAMKQGCLQGFPLLNKKSPGPQKTCEAMEWHEAWNVCSWWYLVKWFS